MVKLACGFGVFYIHGFLCADVLYLTRGQRSQLPKLMPDRTHAKLKAKAAAWLDFKLATFTASLRWRFTWQMQILPLFNYEPIVTTVCKPKDLWQQGNLKQWCQGYLANLPRLAARTDLAAFSAPFEILASALNTQKLASPQLVTLMQALPDTLTKLYAMY